MLGVLALLKKDALAAMNLRRLMREQSLFKVGFILLFAAGMLFGLWALFVEGFIFLDSLGGVGLLLVSRLFALFFLGLGLMLVLSSVITSYTTMFGSEETGYLLLKPLEVGEVALYKSLQSAFFSSWAFFFTIIPFIGAYAWHQHLSVFFSFWTLVYSIPLVLLCSGVGAILCMVIARWLPRGSRLAFLVLLLVLVAGFWLSRRVTSAVATEDDSTLLLTRLIPGLQMASNPLWPSWWVSEGIMSLTRGQWGRGFMLWLVLAANVLLVGALVEAVGRAVFYEDWQRSRYSGSSVKRTATLLGGFERALGGLPADIRAMILKDTRVFFRDPSQWSQSLIFFGLLALYFLNLRSLRYHMLPAEWRNLISFLNVFSVSAVLCSFGSRFVYPQLSLEGQGFWVVGLSPTTMGRVLVAKFAAAVAGMAFVSLTLMYLSTRMLLVPFPVRMTAMGVAAAISVGISGLSTGLGAVFLDVRQQNPSAIVSGFGGTLNLVLSLIFMFGAIVPFGMAFHLHYLGHLGVPELHRAMLLGAFWLVGLTLVTAAIPLALGNRSLKRREY